MRTLLVTKIISSLIVVNSDELEFLTKALILMWPSALFFFLFHFSLSLTLSLTAHSQHPKAVDNIQTIPTLNRFATILPSWLSHLRQSRRRRRDDPHSRRSRRRDDPHSQRSRRRDDLHSRWSCHRDDPHLGRSRRIVCRRRQIVRRTCCFCLLIVTFACRRRIYRRRICSPSSL